MVMLVSSAHRWSRKAVEVVWQLVINTAQSNELCGAFPWHGTRQARFPDSK
jgi:hypothetical protein